MAPGQSGGCREEKAMPLFAGARKQPYERHGNQEGLVVNGKNDIMLPTLNSFIMQQQIPNAQLNFDPDSGHAPPLRFWSCSLRLLDA